jgi:glycosyltransferase involved in cell wall biosynthesis
MRIALLGTQRPELSGGMITVLLIVDALRRLGHEAEVVADSPPPEWAPVEVPWRTDENPQDLLGDADAVITGWTAVETALGAGVERVGHMCAGFEPHLWPDARERFEAIYRLPTVKLVVAPHLRDSIRAEYGIDAAVIGQPIDLSWFSPRSGGRSPESPLRVVTVGPEPSGPLAPVPFKGIRVVLEIVALAREQGVPIELVRVVPRHDELADAEEIDELHVGVPPRDIAAIYRSCDVYLSASTAAEGLGMPAVEAAASGIASVLPAIPSYRGIEGLEGAALVYEPGDLVAAAEMLARLAGDEQLRAGLGRAGAALDLQSQFDPDAVARRIVAALGPAPEAG